MSDEQFDLQKEVAAADARLPIPISNTLSMPLDITIRSMALSIAQRHCGDTTVREGNLYQQLKMDNKLAGPLTVEHVVHCALIFERFIWGEWSRGLASEAMSSALNEVDEALKHEFKDEDPTRPHSGGGGP